MFKRREEEEKVGGGGVSAWWREIWRLDEDITSQDAWLNGSFQKKNVGNE